MSHMRFDLLALTAIVCFTFPGCGAPAASPSSEGGGGPGARIEVIGGNDIDLGLIDESVGTATSTVALKNVSSAPIVLGKNVGTSCGCTAATLDRLKLSPGEQAVMTVTISTTKPAGTAQRVSTTVYDDTGAELVTCSFLNRTRPRWSVFPPNLNLSAEMGGAKSVHFEVLGRNDLPTRLLGVTSNLPRFHATISQEPLSPLAPTSVEISFELPHEAGTYNYDLVFETDDTPVPKRTVPVLLRAQAAWRVMPQSVLISGDESNLVERRLLLVGDERADDVTLELKDTPGVSAVLLPQAGDQRAILLRCAPADTDLFRRGTLTVRVKGNGKECSVSVPVIRLARTKHRG